MDIPTACTLDPEGRAERKRRLDALATEARETRQNAHGETLTFDPDPRIERELRTLIADEQECCPFLDLRLDTREDRIVLTIAT